MSLHAGARYPGPGTAPYKPATSHNSVVNTAYFRFYEELNDFLPSEKRKQTLQYHFDGNPGIKDPIEALGIPHTDVELIIVGGNSVGFDYQLQDQDRVAVYPVFESFDITPLIRLREEPLRKCAFILDVNLGKLAKSLRLLGFDAAYRNDYHDADVVRIGTSEHRTILTRDRRLLYHRAITHGYWVRAIDPEQQVSEVLTRFDLYRMIQPFHRCLECNGIISAVPKQQVLDRLEPLTKKYYEEFYRCEECGKVYWKGSHYEHMVRNLSKFTHRQ